MAKGRKNTPTQLKVVRGNPGKRPIKKTEPKAPVSGDLTPPAWLGPIAKTAWAELASLLSVMRVLTDADYTGLALLCETIQEYRDADSVIQAMGITYETETQTGATMIRTRPEVMIRSDAHRRIQSLLSEFGLTPASRSKVSALPPEKKDEWSAL